MEPAGFIPLLAVQQLSKRYGDSVALSEVSFDLRPNEILGLIGPNGAGKTTLLEALAGLLPVDHGDVLLSGLPVKRDLRHESLFYLPDLITPYEEQFSIDVLRFFATMFDRPSEELSIVIEQLELNSALNKRVSSLSKGYKRRLVLVIALLSNQPILLLDEPFDGFDLRQTRQAMKILQELTVNRTLLLSIHQLSDAEKICDRFVLLSSGKVLGIGNLQELREKSALPDKSLEEVFLALT